MQSISYEMVGWVTHKLESSCQGETAIISDMQIPNHSMAESEEELKSLLMRTKEESESWLKTQHSKN